MSSSAILSLAILKVNWDKLRKNYFDNFVPILAECIRLSPHDVVSVPELQEQIRTRFGLKLPSNSIYTILKRVSKYGYVRLENEVYYRNPDKLQQLDFHAVQQEVIRMHEALINKLIGFCKEKFGVIWSVEHAETALQLYLEEYQFFILTAMTESTIIPEPQSAVKGAKYLVASFVQHLQRTHASEFEYLETIVKGNMLASAIFLPDPGQVQKRFHKTEVVFDTTFLIHAMGYAGQPRKVPCVELIELLYESGANLRCFKHTVEEIRGVLDACAEAIRRPQSTIEYMTPTIDFFLSQGYTPSDIEILSLKIEDNLQALRIKIVEKPPYIPEYVIDEKALDEALGKAIPYRNPRARVRDVDSISAIMRLRKGGEYVYIEDCRAIFVTTNIPLSKTSKDFFFTDTTRRVVPPCITDYTLTNLLWLKRPMHAPDLPRKRIIADCYAATQPAEQFWRLYLVEVDKLEKSGAYSAEDVFLLRDALEAKSALMELTRGEEDAITQATVPEILTRIKAKIATEASAKLESELKSLKEEHAELQEKVEAAKVRDLRWISRIELRAKKISKAVIQILFCAILVILLVGTLSTFPWGTPTFKSAWLNYIISLSQLTVLVISGLDIAKGTTIKTNLRRIEIRLSHWIQSKFSLLIE